MLTFIITIKKFNDIQRREKRKRFDIISIDRLDYFKYEKCLINYKWKNNDFDFKIIINEPIFKNKNMTINLHKQINEFNLRLCRCKNTKINYNIKQ